MEHTVKAYISRLSTEKLETFLQQYAAVGGDYAINPSRLRSKHIECAAHIERLGAYRKSRKGFISTKKAAQMGGFF